MSTIFNWNPDDDQIYIDKFGSQIQLGSGDDFNKYNERFFIMDARDCTLTLKATENTSPNFTSWPDKRSGFGYGSHPEIIVRQGTFQLIGLSQFNCGSSGDPFYPKFVNVSVSDSGHFTVGSQFVYFHPLKRILSISRKLLLVKMVYLRLMRNIYLPVQDGLTLQIMRL